MKSSPYSGSERSLSGSALHAFLPTETTDERWLRRVIQSELDALVSELEERFLQGAANSERVRRSAELHALATLGDAPIEETWPARLQACEAVTGLERLAAFWRRVGWLTSKVDDRVVAKLDPKADCEQIFYSVARTFRTELKVFAVLHEMRAAVALPLANFFLNTGEFSRHGVRRIVDTVLLVCNILEWGFDSQRGRACLERINSIHANFTIPNSAMKYILCGIQFIPYEFNQRFGWRQMTDTERLGWFHAFLELGHAMHIEELSEDFDEMYAWYRAVSENNARYAPNKRRLVQDILSQVLARYPVSLRGMVASAFVAAMDDAYLTATALPRAPLTVEHTLRQFFHQVGTRAQQVNANGYWLQSLLTSSVYPNGYEVDQLGRSESGAPHGFCHATNGSSSITKKQLKAAVDDGKLWVVIDGDVYDLTEFADTHPGGRRTLLPHAGRDASLPFSAAPHSPATRQFRYNYRIGHLRAREVEGPSTTDLPTPSREADSTEHFAQRRGVPAPDTARDLLEWSQALLPLVNGRVADGKAANGEAANGRASEPVLDTRQIAQQLEALAPPSLVEATPRSRRPE